MPRIRNLFESCKGGRAKRKTLTFSAFTHSVLRCAPNMHSLSFSGVNHSVFDSNPKGRISFAETYLFFLIAVCPTTLTRCKL